MYLWVAIDVNEQLCELRRKAEEYAREQHLSSPTFTLPFHISLKISFQIPDEKFDEAAQSIRTFYKTLRSFEIKIKGMEQAGPIVWITMQDNRKLTDIHRKLDQMMLEEYAVAQHTFDKDFRFHTSVFMINDREKIEQAFGVIKDTPLPETLRAEKFIIGASKEGAAGTYQVYEEIYVQEPLSK